MTNHEIKNLVTLGTFFGMVLTSMIILFVTLVDQQIIPIS